MTQVTKATSWLLLALLAGGLVLSACVATPAVERTGSVAVAETGEPTPAPPAATPSATLRARPTEAVEPAVTDALRPTPGVSDTMPTPIPGAQMAPDFTLPDLDGQAWTLSRFRGRPVMLFVWASW